MIYINTDGGSRGNPGPSAIGVVIREDSKILQTYKKRIGTATNNIAEYNSLIKALELVKNHTSDEITISMDSELVIRHLTGKYRVKSLKLLPLYRKTKSLEKNFKKTNYKYVPRTDKFQKIADALVNQALDEK